MRKICQKGMPNLARIIPNIIPMSIVAIMLLSYVSKKLILMLKFLVMFLTSFISFKTLRRENPYLPTFRSSIPHFYPNFSSHIFLFIMISFLVKLRQSIFLFFNSFQSFILFLFHILFLDFLNAPPFPLLDQEKKRERTHTLPLSFSSYFPMLEGSPERDYFKCSSYTPTLKTNNATPLQWDGITCLRNYITWHCKSIPLFASGIISQPQKI